MAFRLTTFGSYTLPTYNVMFDFSTPFMDSMLVPTLNGAIDWYGTRRKINHHQIFEVDAQVDAATLALMADKVRSLKELVGTTAWLTRVDTDGTNSRRRFCRLLGVSFTPRAVQRGIINKVSMRFETLQPFWYSSSLTTHGPTAISSGSDINLTIAGEEDVIDAILTITATGTVSSIQVEHDKTENSESIFSQFTYSQSIVNTDVVIFDCGKYTCTDEGANGLGSFSLHSTHNEIYWLRLPVGAQTLEITLGSGSATYQLDYYAAYQ